MDNDFLKSLVKDLADEHTTIAADGKSSAEFSGTMDTGSYILNAALSGSIYGGVPNNKITAFAGETSTGKTYFVLGVISQFLKSNPDGGVIYFDTESAVTNDMLMDRGIDPVKVIKSEPDTIQKFRHNTILMIDKYLEQDESERRPLIFVLDSLGQLSSTKEIEDTAEGSETRDMTKAQILKATFRVLNLKLAKANVPMLICNHTYDVVGSYYPQKEMSGGSGLKYSASTIAFLSKKKEKDGTEVVGNIIKVKMQKSRLSRENREIEVLLDYTTGLHRYYGLVDLGLKYDVFKKIANRIEVEDGKKVYAKSMYDNPTEYFTPNIMDKLEEAAQKEFQYGFFEDDVEEISEEDSGL
jgi:RecA/RadA recombinase|tara:strand:- start:44 stop:1108 length:1065 start_codon:yes stop_codon:yes gene_type:complete